MKALPVEVYRGARSSYDCTNGGISSRFSSLLVICDEGFVDVDELNPPENLVKVVRRSFGRNGDRIYHLEPVVKPEGAGWMSGGNYAASCDSRFSEMLDGFYGAVAIHDRQESWEQYERNFN